MTADENRRWSAAFGLRAPAALLALASSGLWISGALNGEVAHISLLRWGMAAAFSALALFAPWRMRWPSATAGWAAALVSAFTIFRVIDLDQSPFQLTVDEIQYPFFALARADIYSRPAVVLSGLIDGHFTFISLFAQSWPCLFLSEVVCGRAASVVLGAVSLWFTYALGARLFGRVAGVTALIVVGSSFWHMHYSRVAYPCMQPMTIVPLALYVGVCGVEERNAFLKLLTGMLLGLSVLFYTPSRVAVPVFAIWYLYCVVTRREGARDILATIACVGWGLFLTLGPSLLDHGPVGILFRYRETVFATSAPLGRLGEAGFMSYEALRIMGEQVYDASSIFVTRGATLSPHTWAPVPLIDPVSFALVGAGLLLAIARFQDPRFFLLLTLIVVPFVSGQLMTDIPTSAYRAAPMLPALAILAGCTVCTLGQFLERFGRTWSQWGVIGMLVCLTSVALPFNLAGLLQYYVALSSDNLGSVGRMVAALRPRATYYFVGDGRVTHVQILQYLGHSKKLRDVPSLMDALGTHLGDGGDVVFIINPGMSSAELAIRRCYPGAEPLDGPGSNGGAVVRALVVSAVAIKEGRGCAPATTGPGLLAQYFKGKNWEGEVVIDRVEDWPVRWFTRDDLLHVGSVEWSGSIRIPTRGTYKFWLSTPAAEGTFELGDDGAMSAGLEQAIVLERGFQPLRIRCRPSELDGACVLRWMPPGGGMQVVPAEILSPAISMARQPRLP